MEKCLYRGFILVSFKAGKTSIETTNDLKSAYGDAAPTYMTVTRWMNRFRDGSEDLNDLSRPGQPITETTMANIEILRELIETNPYISYRQIEALTTFSKYTIGKIINEHLLLRKICSRWVPHNLSSEQKAKRVSMCRYNLEMFNSGKWRLCDIMTCDESWIYHRHIGNKS